MPTSVEAFYEWCVQNEPAGPELDRLRQLIDKFLQTTARERAHEKKALELYSRNVRATALDYVFGTVWEAIRVSTPDSIIIDTNGIHRGAFRYLLFQSVELYNQYMAAYMADKTYPDVDVSKYCTEQHHVILAQHPQRMIFEAVDASPAELGTLADALVTVFKIEKSDIVIIEQRPYTAVCDVVVLSINGTFDENRSKIDVFAGFVERQSPTLRQKLRYKKVETSGRIDDVSRFTRVIQTGSAHHFQSGAKIVTPHTNLTVIMRH